MVANLPALPYWKDANASRGDGHGTRPTTGFQTHRQCAQFRPGSRNAALPELWLAGCPFRYAEESARSRACPLFCSGVPLPLLQSALLPVLPRYQAQQSLLIPASRRRATPIRGIAGRIHRHRQWDLPVKVSRELRYAHEIVAPELVSVPIIVFEDHLIANLVRAVLRKHGYNIVVTSAAQAAELIGDSEKKKLLITNSPQCFLEFADRVPLLYLTSAPDHELRSAFVACRVVHKPFTPQELLDAVQALVSPDKIS
jgi:hypothetical protein